MRYNQKQPKQRKTVNFKENGFKPIKGQPGYFINIHGIAFNNYSGREMAINQGKYYCFPKENGLILYLTAAKLVLQAFGNKPYLENKHVIFIDGNKRNFHVDNLKYQQESYEPVIIDKTALLTAIRCYCPVHREFKPVLNNFYTRFFLDLIALSRSFYNNHKDHIEMLEEYLSIRQQSVYSIAKKEKLPVRDCYNYLNELINCLSFETVEDLNNGLLKIKPYIEKETEKQRKKRVYSEWKNFIESIKGNEN